MDSNKLRQMIEEMSGNGQLIAEEELIVEAAEGIAEALSCAVADAEPGFRAIVSTGYRRNILCHSRAELQIVTRELREKGRLFEITIRSEGEG